MTLEIEQSEMKQRSQTARSKRQSRNARNPRKKQVPRVRVAAKTQLIELVQDPKASGPTKLEALKLRLWLEGKLTFEQLVQLTDKGLREETGHTIDKEPEQTPAPVSSGSVLEPAKSY